MHLRVAGFTIHVTCGDRNLRVAPSRAAERFLVEPAPADVEIDVASGNLERERFGDCRFDSGGPWRLHRDGDGFLFTFFSSTLESSPYKIARFTQDFSVGQVTLHRPFFERAATIDPLEYPLDELLVISLLSLGKGVEMHGCGIVTRDSRAYLFVGQSGAGKSTMARLWLDEPGTIVLSDDRVVLRDDGDGLWMHGTPWHGEEPLASPQRARPAAIFFLRHSSRHELTGVGRAESVARLFAASFPPFHDARAVDFTLAFLDRVASRVPCRELAFTPDSTVIDAVGRAGTVNRDSQP